MRRLQNPHIQTYLLVGIILLIGIIFCVKNLKKQRNIKGQLWNIDSSLMTEKGFKNKSEENIQDEPLEDVTNGNHSFGSENKVLMECLDTCMGRITEYRDDLKGFCGIQAEERGPHQKVVSFVFYGDFESDYYKGIKANVESIEAFYPGWVVRLHVDGSKMKPGPGFQLCHLACQSGRFDICPVNKLPVLGDISDKFGMVWRFIPMADPLVDFMISRDLDSRFSKRETAAVDDWLQTGLPFHAMRDHPCHSDVILGGMWGVRLDTGYREKYKDLLLKLLNNKESTVWKKPIDQKLLKLVVWPEIQNEVVVHDSYHCNSNRVPNNRPFPTRRNNDTLNFVGSLREMKIDKECPEECRPEDHKDWITC